MSAHLKVLYLLFLFVIGCENASNPTGPSNGHQRLDGLIPMKVGYYWVYLWSSYDTTGHQYPGHALDTVTIVRDTMINNEPWFIFSDGIVRTNRKDGVWFLSQGEPRLGFPLILNDSTCTAPQPAPCEYYVKLIAIGQHIYVIGVPYDANVYDWIFPEFTDWPGLRWYTVSHLGHVRMESYSTTPSGYHFVQTSRDLLYSFVN